jgi:hypothetical protein
MKTTLCARRAGTSWVLTWLLLAALGLNAWSLGGGNQPSGGGAPPNPTALGGNDEEGGSMPIVRDSYGLTFVGRLRELRTLAISVRGSGRIDVARLGGGLIGVTLIGDYVVELDRAVLANSSVLVAFRGGATFANGIAFLQVGSSTARFDSDRVPLPVPRLAATRRAQGNLLTLDVLTRTQQAHVTATFALDRVTMTQRIL